MSRFPNLTDLGPTSQNECDYPDLAQELCLRVLSEGNGGILICGSGIGMSIAANRFSGIRAALCRTVQDAEAARLHNDANVLVMSASTIDAIKMVEVFCNTQFKGGKHATRVEKIERKCPRSLA